MTAIWEPTAGDQDGSAVEAVAVIGLACRLPGARDAGEFWRNLVDGTESVRFSSREEQAALGVTAPIASCRATTRTSWRCQPSWTIPSTWTRRSSA